MPGIVRKGPIGSRGADKRFRVAPLSITKVCAAGRVSTKTASMRAAAAMRSGRNTLPAPLSTSVGCA